MNALARPENKDDIQDTQSSKLMVNGFLCPENTCALSVEVKRGMTIRSKEGLEVGKVAAIVLNGEDRKATHILLSRLPEIRGYWLVSVGFIATVHEEDIQLTIPVPAVDSLPPWHSI